jgi:hypothetical protein
MSVCAVKAQNRKVSINGTRKIRTEASENVLQVLLRDNAVGVMIN